jgi:hypothetical protein
VIPGDYNTGGLTNKGTPGADNGKCPRAAAAGEIVLTELMASPDSNPADKQYVEIYNTTDDPIRLDGCKVTTTSGNVALTGRVLDAHSYGVIGSDAHVAVALPAGTLFANGDLGLDAAKDTVTLACDDGQGGSVAIDVVAYDTANGWQVTQGKALNLDPGKYDATENDDPANWCDASTEITGDYSNDSDGSGGVLPNYGTPGAANTSCTAESPKPGAGDVVITELMPNPDKSDAGREYIEMYNTTGHALSLAGCVINSKNDNGFTIEAMDDGLHDTEIPANGYMVFGTSDTVKSALPMGIPFYQYTGVTLGNKGDWVELKCDDTLIDRVDYSSSKSGHSYNLDPAHYDAVENDEAGNWCNSPDTSPINSAYNTDEKINYGTPGAANVACQ